MKCRVKPMKVRILPFPILGRYCPRGQVALKAIGGVKPERSIRLSSEWTGVPNWVKAADCKSVTLETLVVRVHLCPNFKRRLKMYKQCKLQLGNMYTYKWLNEKIAKADDLINYRNEKWTIARVWHFKEQKKYLADMHCIG